MSYPPQGPPYQQYGAPPPGHSPQPGYGQPPGGPPPGQYAPPGQSPYPPQQQYAPPPPGQQYGAPSPGYGSAPPTGQYGVPPAQHYPPPGPPGPYGAPPQSGPGGYPPQAGGHPPYQQQQQPPYGQPQGQYPPQHGMQQPGMHQPGIPQPGMQQPYGGGAPGGYAQPTPPSPGYAPGQMAGGDATQDVDILFKAMKGFGTDEAALIGVLAKRDPLQMALIRSTFSHRHGKSLESRIESETSGYFRDGLMALVRGPLEQDVYNVHRSIKGAGTKETLLNDVILGRSNADLNAIKQEYQRVYYRPLEKDVKDDLSAKTERLFSMILAGRRAEESTPVYPQEVDQDVTALHRATEGKVGTDQITVCQIIATRSDGQLRAIVHAYEQKYHIALEKVILKAFSGHMEDALVLMLRAAVDRPMHDAMLLEDAMKGMGTKDDLLVNRVVRCHWNRQHMEQVKGAYRVKFGKELGARIRGETKGDYEKLMLACVG
ncbi:MAG: hypothetical protein M1837_004015 [Sclerophora amabilis]|nr:MAG: hypothetical protein M1837_004015 [Sclerophora amabilis]